MSTAPLPPQHAAKLESFCLGFDAKRLRSDRGSAGEVNCPVMGAELDRRSFPLCDEPPAFGRTEGSQNEPSWKTSLGLLVSVALGTEPA
jgi:hypothetical protein